MQQGQSVSLATFFNSFSAGKWRKFTKIKNLSFTVQSEAGIAVTFYKAHGSKNTEALENVHKTYRDKTDISGLFDMNSAGVNVGLKTMLEDELAGLGINSKVDVGLNGTGIGEKSNEYYTKKGNQITHEQLMGIFNK